MSTIKSSNKIVQKGYGLPLVFDIANRRYTYRAADDPRFLNLDSIATAKSAWVLRFKNKIDGLPQAYIVFSQTERPLDPIEYLADIDELYGIPDDELIKVAARSHIVDGYGEAHDTFCDRYMRRLEDMGQELGIFAAIPARFPKIIPNNTFTYQTSKTLTTNPPRAAAYTGGGLFFNGEGKMTTRNVSVKIDHKLYTALKTRAELDNSSVSDEIRSLLRSALAAEELDLYGNEVASFIRGVVDARMDVAALDIERKLDATEDRIAAVLSRPMTAAIMAGLMSADVLKASYASLDDVPVADIWKNYLAQAGELSRAGLGRIDEVKLHARERADG